MSKPYEEINRHLKRIISDEGDLELKFLRLAKIAVGIDMLKEKERKKLVANLALNAQKIAGKNVLLLKSFLFYLSKEDSLLKEISVDLFQNMDSLEAYHYLIWKIRISIFQFSGQLKPATIHWIKERCMRPSYVQMVDGAIAFIEDSNEYKPRVGVKKVGLAVGQLLGELHAPSRTALMLATGLINQCGLDVHIINTNFIPVARPLQYFGCTLANYHDKLSGKQAMIYTDAEFGPATVTTYSQLPGPFDFNRMLSLWNYIEQEGFDALINLGDVLFAFDYFMGKIPILSIPTSRDLPIAKADQYVLSHDVLTPEEQVIADKNTTCAPKLSVTFNANPLKGTEIFHRQDYGLTEDAFVFVVVGHRLSQELDKEFFKICHNLLKANDKNHLFFVGDFQNMLILLKDCGLAATGRARSFEAQNDLRSFYGICDVYLNPFRSGGGVSGQAAIAEALPVVTLARGDVAGSLKPELRQQTLQEYESLALQLSLDKSYYQQWQDAMREIALSRQSNQKNITLIHELLLDLNKNALERYNVRTSKDILKVELS